MEDYFSILGANQDVYAIAYGNFATAKTDESEDKDLFEKILKEFEGEQKILDSLYEVLDNLDTTSPEAIEKDKNKQYSLMEDTDTLAEMYYMQMLQNSRDLRSKVSYETTLTQDQIDTLSQKYDTSDFYYYNSDGSISCRFSTRGEGKVEEFYQDLVGMGKLSEEDYELLRSRELWSGERIGLYCVTTGEWVTPEYFGREYRKELIDEYGEEGAEAKIAELMGEGYWQNMSDVFAKLSGIFQEVFHEESADKADVITEACIGRAEFFKKLAEKS